MSNNWVVKPEQAEVLMELEIMIGKSIPLVDEIKWYTVGVKIKKDNIIGLGLFKCELVTLPESITKLISLQTLELPYNKLTTLPESITKIKSLQTLNLVSTQLTTLPESIGNLESLQELNLARNQLTTLPELIGNLKSLQRLYIKENQLTTLPESIGDLKSLQTLNLRANKLNSLPESIGDLKSLQTLSLRANKLTSLLESITKLESLQELNLARNLLNTLPESIGNLESLQELNLARNHLTTLPESISNLKSLQGLYINENQLSTLPESIGDLNSLQTLNSRANNLTSLPKSIGDLNLLQTLILGYNKLISLPESIGNLQSLQELNLVSNQLKILPDSIGNLQSLQKLNLVSNQLKTLPDSISRLNNLKIFVLMHNPWIGEWEELAKRDVNTLREILKKRVSINVFISHTVNEFVLYRIKELAEYLEQQPEINQVYYCEEDLRGNIDAWMEETVPKSQLLLFIGTQHSKLSKDCWEERRLALKNEIPIIPIKGLDVDWKDLTSIGLSRELGFEFEEKYFEKLCADLYKYIYEFKRERDLVTKDQDEVEKSKLEIITLFDESLKSDVYRSIFTENISKLNEIKQKYKSRKITFKEFLLELINTLEKKNS